MTELKDEVKYKVLLRGKDYDVYVKLSSSPMTTIRFVYNKTTLERQVFLPSDIDENDIYRILTISVKDAITKYNAKMKYKR